MKRKIEVDDSLEERIESAKEEVKGLIFNWLDENAEKEDSFDVNIMPDLFNDLNYSGEFHEIIDSSVPVYTGEINDLWYLYGEKFKKAYYEAGVGDNPLENSGMTAIYLFIEGEIAEWYEKEKKNLFREWAGKKDARD